MNAPTPHPVVRWTEDGQERQALWRSERGAPPPRNIVVVDDQTRADDAYGLACQGVGLLWRGDFHNARQLLTALASRVDHKSRRSGKRVAKGASGSTSTAAPASAQAPAPVKLSDAFNLERQARSQRARTLGLLLVPLEADYGIPLRRAPDLRQACLEAYGPADEASLVSLRELQGVVGAHEWRVKGIPVPAAGGRIHPWHGVFAPTRSEYIDLVAQAPLHAAAMAASAVAFDIGTGTGVLAAVLARRGVPSVVATDQSQRALDCARDNMQRLGLADRVQVVQADLFPEGRAALVVCNPPWVPARPASPLEQGVYDPDSRMLLGFLSGLAAHLQPDGEGWLILSDLAEHLGLRTRETLMAAFDAAGLTVLGRTEARPAHGKTMDPTDPLHAARVAERTSLWRLGVA